MSDFDGNGYRKRVFAAVQRRGGADASDAFELYDIPVEQAGSWSDAQVAAQLAEVWAFWQRQRDHPKYGTLASLLVESHEERSAPLRDARQRAALAERVREVRGRREAERFELLDQAVRRLVERHRGVPRDKVAGLIDIGAMSGLSADEVRARLRHHRLVDGPPAAPPPPTTPSLGEHRRRQVRDLLDEFGRLEEMPPPPTLLALLGLAPDAAPGEIAIRADAWRARCRELPPTRVRAVADELLVHVRDLLEAGRPTLEAYLDAVAQDVAAQLAPRVRAAVLVEDRLVVDDYEHLYGEALALGLDAVRARRVVTDAAAALGVAVETSGSAERSREPAPASRPSTDTVSERELRNARAALRAGRLHEARGHAAAAAAAGGADGTTVRAVADEIEDALRAALLRWRAVATALAARRFAEAVEHLEQLSRTASDVADPASGARPERELARARAEVAAADEQVAAARAGRDPVRALLGVLERWPDHPGAVAALAAAPLEPPRAVTALRDRAGAVVVTWQPSTTGGVSYRVARRGADGATRVVGRTAGTRVEDGGAAAGSVPEYVVVALLAGRVSAEARSGAAPAGPVVPVVAVVPVAPADPAPVVAAPADVTATRLAGGAVLVRWDGPAGAEYKVSRRAPDGRWQVVGRTRATSLEDGGAPADGPPPGYTVVAARDGVVSAEASTG
ncbi:hypothetical protein SAMN05443575_0827 [Jatrophihabitans endophyticus]|uniref:Fibronectin type-III domain-containing protein n=1 Tax=Jatrophihabitans endophyticus TaxID=1206085 RepID=A0A1M5E9H8_9ACTN|nr:hypothetical protein [Jatrophihabitans endophyticus]SHF75867.1 hypothetical protein SAMN05443575_0827 [Jatrophihabitans endophyticus]